MTKVKPARQSSKDSLMRLKNGSVHKKKQQKFKKTPIGKVPLINGSKKKPTNGKVKSQNASDSPTKKKKSPKFASPKSESPKIPKKSSPKKAKVEDEEDDSSSDVDYNEGISITEVVSAADTSSSSNDADDDDVPDIFGTSLAEATDEDDDEFDADSADEADQAVENKGVKMFKGLKSKGDAKESSEDDEDDDEDDEDDDDEEEDEAKSPTVKVLLGDSIVDESDDEDFVGDQEPEESDDEIDSDDEVDQSMNSSTVTTITDEDDDEDDDEESDDDDEESDNDEDDDDDDGADLGDILGTSLADETDDDDFEGDDDEATSDDDEDDAASSPAKNVKVTRSKKTIEDDDDDANVKKSKKSKTMKDPVENPQLVEKQKKEEQLERTIFIGNVPKDTQLSLVRKTFNKFGPIENMRMRGVVAADPRMSLKVTAIKKNFHPKSTNVCWYVTYKNIESVDKALSMNGKRFEGNYLRVDRAKFEEQSTDNKHTVFLGNLPFTIVDNVLWETFRECGRIESVRVIRDRHTGVSRGFGYINFETPDGAALAMHLDGTVIQGRAVRVKAGHPKGKFNKGGGKRQRNENVDNGKDGSPKKTRFEERAAAAIAKHNSVNAVKRTEKKQKRSQGEKQRFKSDSTSPQDRSPKKFQGQKSDAKKKFKPDKSAKKKKQMAGKLMAKTKKPAKQ